MEKRISVTIIAKNEAQRIEKCLNSVSWADEIVVVDSGSTDRTREICRRYGCRVVETEWLGFGGTKRLAVENATSDWILSVDADETVTPELRTAIRDLFRTEPAYHGYRVRRVSYYLGEMIRFSGWQNDAPLRLFDRRFGTFDDEPVHEAVDLEGPTGFLEAPLVHDAYPTVSSHMKKMNLYSELSAARLQQRGKSVSLPGAMARGAMKFVKMYLLQKGFLDGKIGFILASNSAYGVYLKYLKLWRLSR